MLLCFSFCNLIYATHMQLGNKTFASISNTRLKIGAKDNSSNPLPLSIRQFGKLAQQSADITETHSHTDFIVCSIVLKVKKLKPEA